MSPTSLLHLVPSDKKETARLCVAHGKEMRKEMRHHYFRNMLGLSKSEQEPG